MIEFTPLASSSAGCAYKLSCPSFPSLLIDCGLTFKQLQEALHFEVSKLAGCLVSHAHGDHSKAVEGVMKAGVPVYASMEAWGKIPYSAVRAHKAKHVGCNLIYAVGPWKVRPFAAVHDSPGTLGFLIDSPEGDRLLYLTDSAYSPVTFPGLTHIAVECNYDPEILKANAGTGEIDQGRAVRTVGNHMSLPTLLDMLEANDMSKLQEVHLLHLSDANSDEVAFKKAVQKVVGCPVYIAAK